MPLISSRLRPGYPGSVPPASGFRAVMAASLVCLALFFATGTQAAGASRGTQASKRETAKSKPPAPASAPMEASNGPRLDSAKVHMLYVEGEFDQAINILEANLRDTRQYNHNDSVFIYKHLGVMYAATDATREKGRYYMHRLLMVEPTAKIMDMYASDMIYMIFKNIQEEYEATHVRKERPDSAEVAARLNRRPRETGNDEANAAREEPHKGGSGYIWLGAAAVAVAAGAATLYYISEEKPKVVVQDHQPE